MLNQRHIKITTHVNNTSIPTIKFEYKIFINLYYFIIIKTCKLKALFEAQF